MGKKRIPLGVLGLPAILQLQSEGFNVSKELTDRGRSDLICTVAPPVSKAPLIDRINKYGVSAAEDRTHDGITFDSKLEKNAYILLKDYGVDFTYHPVYELQEAFKDGTGRSHRAIRYEGDFLLNHPAGAVLIDMKGVLTPSFKMKEKMLIHKYGLTLYCPKSLNKLMLLLAEHNLIGPKKLLK
jgi:hypothetical protein